MPPGRGSSRRAGCRTRRIARRARASSARARRRPPGQRAGTPRCSPRPAASSGVASGARGDVGHGPRADRDTFDVVVPGGDVPLRDHADCVVDRDRVADVLVLDRVLEQRLEGILLMLVHCVDGEHVVVLVVVVLELAAGVLAGGLLVHAADAGGIDAGLQGSS